MVRIRSEHAIGYLKGRFQSLKSLRVNIRDETSHKFATYWVAACVAIHSFSMECEAKEQSDDEDGVADVDPFIAEGLSSSSSGSDNNAGSQIPVSQTRLQAGKCFREQLKESLFRAKEQHRQQHTT